MSDSKKQEVLIIGAGIIGLSIARELRKEGITNITIMERGEVGKESSYAAGGMLAPHAETDEIDDFYHLCRESLDIYPEYSEQLRSETGIDIELERSGTLYLAFDERDAKELHSRFGWQKKAGLPVERLSAREILRLEPFVSRDVVEGLFFPSDWQVDNRKLIRSLHKFCELNKIEIIEKSEIKRLLSENGKIVGAQTAIQKHFAEKVILATGAWTSFIKTTDFSLPVVKPIRGQMIGLQTAERLITRVIYSPRGYLIPRLDGRILVGGTSEDAGFEKGISDSANEYLFERALEIAPGLVNLEIKESWTGLRPFVSDGWPVLGEIAENLFVATGHYRNGILLTPITARILSDKIVNDRDSRYFEAFGPDRFRAMNAGK